MSLTTAFGISEEDIENVLLANAVKVANSGGKDFEAMAQEIYNEFDDEDFDRVAKAALDSGTEMDEQTDGAYAEIRLILVEQGVLKN